MVQKFFSRANSRLGVGSAAALLAASTLLSSILGLYRDKLLLSTYYQTWPAGIDAYKIAFTIPDFMFFVLVSGALSVTFIPVFNERLAKGNKKSAWELSTSLINFLAIATLITSILIIIFAEPLVNNLIAPGSDEVTRGLAVSMMRVIAINPFLFAISSVLASMQQATGRFFFFALAPTLYSIGIIIGILFFAEGISMFGVTLFQGGIMGVALGVVLGSILQLIVSSLGLIGMGFDYRFKIFWKNKGFRQVLRLLPPRSIDQGIDYFNNLVEINLASRLGQGLITAYQTATTLHMVPVTLIGVAISTAAFPKMTERLSQGRPDLFRKELQTILRVIIWLVLPTAVITFLARGQLVGLLVTGGDEIIANILGLLVVAILFRSVYHIASRSFYAQQDTKTPLYISIATIGLNILLAILFVMKFNMGVYGLAAAQSIVALVEVAILFIIMSTRIKGLFDIFFLHAILRMVSASGLMFVVTYITVKIFDLNATDQSFFTVFPKFAIVVLAGLGTYLIASRIFRLEEANPVISTARKIVFNKFKTSE